MLVLVVAVLGLLAGCAAFDALSDLQGDLEEEGFRDVSANVSPTDASLVVVSASAPPDQEVEEAQRGAAEVVWNQFPRRFEALRVTIDGERAQWGYAELEDELGARPDGLDTSTEIGDEWTRMSIILVVALMGAGVIGLLLVGLVVFLVVRSRRRRTAAAGPRPHPQPWMPPGVPGAPPAGPVAPPSGWTTASAPPGPPTHGPAAPPTPPTPPLSLAKAPEGPEVPPAPEPQPPPRPPVPPSGPRPRDPDARRLGRRPRGPVPDQAHTPPGWG